MTHEQVEAGKHALDGVSVLTAIGALVNILPSIAALFTIIWTGIRIVESETWKELMKKRRSK